MGGPDTDNGGTIVVGDFLKLDWTPMGGQFANSADGENVTYSYIVI